MSDVNRTDVTVNLVDVEGKTINDTVKILYYNQKILELRDSFEKEFQGEPIILPKIPASPTGQARFVFNPSHYRSKIIMKNVIGGQNFHITEDFFVAPDKAKPKLIGFADIANKTYGKELLRILDKSNIDETVWNKLDKRNRATILNLSAKMSFEKIQNGQPIIELIEEIKPELLDEEHRARIYARVNPNLLSKLRNFHKRFDPAPGLAHKFPEGWNPFAKNSVKSRDEAGNIQFTFATNNDGLFLADIDLDDHTGVKHAFEVLLHTLSGVDTDPYNLHQILIRFQQLNPEYSLL